MTEIKKIPGPGGRSYTHGSDACGEYGSLFLSEEEESIPPPLDFEPGEELEQKFLRAEADESAVTDSDARNLKLVPRDS